MYAFQISYFQANAVLPRLILISVLKIISILVEVNLVVSTIFDIAGNTSFLSILGAHLLFNMKEAGEKGLNQGTGCGSKSTVSSIGFAERLPAIASKSQGEIAAPEMIEFEEIC